MILLLVFSAARAAIGFFPKDAPDTAHTVTGRAHDLLAAAAFAAVTAGLLMSRMPRLTLFGMAERLIYIGFLSWVAILGALALS